jgi:hypothetical protein
MSAIGNGHPGRLRQAFVGFWLLMAIGLLHYEVTVLFRPIVE